MLRKLAAYRRQNQLDLALQELGRIERTLFMLDWLAAMLGSTRASSVISSRSSSAPSNDKHQKPPSSLRTTSDTKR
jgi:Tn3 transposase DDE domain-containing protein